MCNNLPDELELILRDQRVRSYHLICRHFPFDDQFKTILPLGNVLSYFFQHIKTDEHPALMYADDDYASGNVIIDTSHEQLRNAVQSVQSYLMKHYTINSGEFANDYEFLLSLGKRLTLIVLEEPLQSTKAIPSLPSKV